LVVIGGGGIFYSYWLPFSLAVIAAIKKPIIFFGVGYIREVDAPPLSREAIKSAVALAKQVLAIGVRDFKTKEFLVKNGVAARKIKVIGDPAALLAEKRPGAATIKKLALVKADGKIRIGFNLNYSGWLGFGKWRADILQAYQEVATYFQKEYGGVAGADVEFYYLKHHPGEVKIYPELKIRGLKIVDLAPTEQKYIYGQLDLIIGMMLHVGVMAFGAGTPEISVAYDLRNHSFAEFIGCPELVVDLKDLKNGELLRRAKMVFTKKRKYSQKFIIKIAEIYKRQKLFLKQINL
jgi:polysaccharide pyruvyl transferase WcaK-like protein